MAEFLGGAPAHRDVAREHRRRQPELRAVGDAKRIVQRVEDDDRGDRPERFLFGDAHLGSDAGEDRGLVEALGGPTPELDRRAERDGIGDVLLGSCHGALMAHRTHIGCLVQWVADPESLRPLRQQGDEPVVDISVHQDALSGRADLARHIEAARYCGVRGGLQICVCQHDLRPVPTELQHPLLEPRVHRHLLPGLDRSGEHHRRHIGMPHQRRPNLASTVHEVHRPGREPCVVQDVDEHLGTQRRHFGGLPHRRASERQSEHDRDPGDVDREVPR